MMQQHDGQRVIVHLDMDCFYVQVERNLNPNLRNKPVAVVQYNPFGDLKTVTSNENRIVNSNGSIIAVSYEARALGVKRIMRSNEARKVCPELITVQVPTAHGKADISIYRDAGSDVVKILQQANIIVEKASIDEVYVDLTQQVNLKLAAVYENPHSLLPTILEAASSSLVAGDDVEELKFSKSAIRNGHAGTSNTATTSHGQAESCLTPQQWASWNSDDKRLHIGAALVAELRQLIADKLGFTCSGGIAHNKMLAKIASGMHKPNKQTLVPSSIVLTLMKSMPFTRVPGFGGKLGEALAAMPEKLVTFGDVDRVDRETLTKRFGEETVIRILNAAKGLDAEPVKERAHCQSIASGKSFTFQNSLPQQGLRDGRVLHWLTELCAELSERLRADLVATARKPRSLSVYVSIMSQQTNQHMPQSHVNPNHRSDSAAAPNLDTDTDTGVGAEAPCNFLAATIGGAQTLKPIGGTSVMGAKGAKADDNKNNSSSSSGSGSSSGGGRGEGGGGSGGANSTGAATRKEGGQWWGSGLSISRIGPMPPREEALAPAALALLIRAIADAESKLRPPWVIRYMSVTATHFEPVGGHKNSISNFFSQSMGAPRAPRQGDKVAPPSGEPAEGEDIEVHQMGEVEEEDGFVQHVKAEIVCDGHAPISDRGVLGGGEEVRRDGEGSAGGGQDVDVDCDLEENDAEEPVGVGARMAEALVCVNAPQHVPVSVSRGAGRLPHVPSVAYVDPLSAPGPQHLSTHRPSPPCGEEEEGGGGGGGCGDGVMESGKQSPTPHRPQGRPCALLTNDRTSASARGEESHSEPGIVGDIVGEEVDEEVLAALPADIQLEVRMEMERMAVRRVSQNHCRDGGGGHCGGGGGGAKTRGRGSGAGEEGLNAIKRHRGPDPPDVSGPLARPLSFHERLDSKIRNSTGEEIARDQKQN